MMIFEKIIAVFLIGFVSLMFYGLIGYGIGSWAASLFSVGEEWQERIASGIGLLAIVLGLFSLTKPISSKRLVERVEKNELKENSGEDIEEFLKNLKSGDEIWYWSTERWKWKMLMGRCGYVIVRDGRPTRHLIVTGMN